MLRIAGTKPLSFFRCDAARQIVSTTWIELACAGRYQGRRRTAGATGGSPADQGVRPGVRPTNGQVGRAFSISVMLGLMSWRSGHLWALGACIALVVVLVCGCQAGPAGGAVAGMSAPAAPTTSFESAPAAKLLQSHFDWCGHVLQSYGLSLSVPGMQAHLGTRQGAGAAPAHYGPLHRRPPPSFS